MAAVDPSRLVVEALSRQPVDPSSAERVVCLAAGKAAAGMAGGARACLPGLRGLVVVPGGTPPRPGDDLERVAGSHPAPDERSEAAGLRALALASSVPHDGLALVLLSGGASALMAVPAAGLTWRDKAAAAAALMAAGAPIADLNRVRKHLSRIKGGRLGAAARWRVRTLAISDVHAPVEDDPSIIGSGPTVPDASTFAEALEVVRRSGATVPLAVRRHLEAGARGEREETPTSTGGVPVRFEVIGNRHTAMAGARAAATALGYTVEVLPAATSGEARTTGRAFAERAGGIGASSRPACVIASGETVVAVAGDGSGGRNQEFALGAVPGLEALAADGVLAAVASAGTDGIDGPTDAAGGIADSTSARRARQSGVDLARALARNDAYPALAALGDLLVWGPTGTNVGDLHVLLIAPGGGPASGA